MCVRAGARGREGVGSHGLEATVVLILDTVDGQVAVVIAGVVVGEQHIVRHLQPILDRRKRRPEFLRMRVGATTRPHAAIARGGKGVSNESWKVEGFVHVVRVRVLFFIFGGVLLFWGSATSGW